MTSPGPVFFRQPRWGRRGETFYIYKLRTMRTDAEAVQTDIMTDNESDGPLFKMRADPRITGWVLSCAGPASMSCPSC